MSIQYQAVIIEAFAADLYRRADKALAAATAWGIALGFVIGTFGVGGYIAFCESAGYSASVVDGLVIFTVPMAFFGYMGRRRGIVQAFMFKLQAQTALCQVQIEKNTRAAAERASEPMAAAERRAA